MNETPEHEEARQLAERMAAKGTHAATALRAAEILEERCLPGDANLRTTLLFAADLLPWTYGVMPASVDDVMTGLLRTADEIVQQAGRRQGRYEAGG